MIHGNPSGLDNTTSCFGGAVTFTRREEITFKRMASLPQLDILLSNTNVPRSTKVLVAKVKELRDEFPEVVNPILESIERISQQFVSLCARRFRTIP